MRTHLGASSELEKADQLPDGWTNNCRLLHCEGYCLYKPDLMRGAMQAAKKAGAEVCNNQRSAILLPLSLTVKPGFGRSSQKTGFIIILVHDWLHLAVASVTAACICITHTPS